MTMHVRAQGINPRQSWMHVFYWDSN